MECKHHKKVWNWNISWYEDTWLNIQRGSDYQTWKKKQMYICEHNTNPWSIVIVNRSEQKTDTQQISKPDQEGQKGTLKLYNLLVGEKTGVNLLKSMENGVLKIVCLAQAHGKWGL